MILYYIILYDMIWYYIILNYIILYIITYELCFQIVHSNVKWTDGTSATSATWATRFVLLAMLAASIVTLQARRSGSHEKPWINWSNESIDH